MYLLPSRQPEVVTKNKTVATHQVRTRSPAQHASFLSHLQVMSWRDIVDSNDAETAYNLFYTQIKSLLNTF